MSLLLRAALLIALTGAVLLALAVPASAGPAPRAPAAASCRWSVGASFDGSPPFPAHPLRYR